MTTTDLATFTREAALLVRANDDHAADFAEWELEASA
jgi:hypothetical protein